MTPPKPRRRKKPRNYRKRDRKDYLKYARSRKHTAQKTRAAIRKQLGYLKRDLDAIDAKLSMGKALSERQSERLDTLRKIFEQQKYMYENGVHSVPDSIVSVSRPFIRPIVRGKVGKPVEFGAKLDISVVDGWTRLEYCSFDAYNEAGNLQAIAERFRAREGHYPIIPNAFSRIRSIGTGTIWRTARSIISGCPARRSAGRRRILSPTRNNRT